MRTFVLVLFFSVWGYNGYSSTKTDSILTQLKLELSRKKTYDDQKEHRISTLKAKLEGISKTNYLAQYDICGKLYEEYKVITDIVTQLPPVMEGFYSDEHKRTCSKCGAVMSPPIKKG